MLHTYPVGLLLVDCSCLDCTGRDSLTNRNPTTCYLWYCPTAFCGSAMRPCQALSKRASGIGTVLMAAATNEEPAMVTEVAECMRINIPVQQKVIRKPRANSFGI